MIIQRFAFVALFFLAIFFGINLVSATARFIEVNQTYDKINISLTEFEYSGPREVVNVSMEVTNPSDQDIIIVSSDLRFSADSHFVGGGGIRPNLQVSAGETEEFTVNAKINDVQYMLRIDPEDQISWLVLARLKTSIDDDLEPIWIEFAFRTVTA